MTHSVSHPIPPLKNLSKLRQDIDPKAYKRSSWHTNFWCVLDLSLYLLFITGVFVSESHVARLVFGLFAGLAASSMFVLAHDAAHGSLFKNSSVAELIGTLYMLPALNMYRLWCFGHNRIHHGFTSYSPVDWIWRPLTVAQYKHLSRFQKILYRIERSLAGCGLHYFRKVWWPEMICFMPKNLDTSKKIILYAEKILVLSFAVGLGLFFYYHAGFFSVICALVIPFIVFNYVISLIVYLHHTHPDIPFFDEKNEWNQTIGAVHCTTVIHTNWMIEKFLTHNILIHTPHHMDIRIPFYRLKTAYQSLKPKLGHAIHEYTLDWKTLRHIFTRCKLYDFKQHQWYDFNFNSKPQASP